MWMMGLAVIRLMEKMKFKDTVGERKSSFYEQWIGFKSGSNNANIGVMISWLLSFGDKVEVIEPMEILERIKESLKIC